MSEPERCGQKIVYQTPEQAEKSRRMFHRITEEIVAVYRCRDCRKWHIGHPEQRTSQQHREPTRNPGRGSRQNQRRKRPSTGNA